MLYDGEVVQPKGGVAPAAGEPDDVVLPVIDELGALLNVDVIGAHVEDDSDVAFVLQGRTSPQVRSALVKSSSGSTCVSLLTVVRRSALTWRPHGGGLCVQEDLCLRPVPSLAEQTGLTICS